MEPQILYEDEGILVVNKPVGMVVNRAESIKGVTVQDWVENSAWWLVQGAKCNDKLFLSRSGVCHRLDKETSGCLLIAKNPESLLYYLKLFKTRKISKKYLALVHGKVEPKEGSVVLPLRRSILEREKWHVHYEGKKAITFWKVLESFDFSEAGEHWRNKLSMLELDLKTGRTHQIRVHLSFLGWPIFSDERYLNKKQLQVDLKHLGHHFLHSNKIAFADELGSKIEVEAPLPDDCQSLVSRLENIS